MTAVTLSGVTGSYDGDVSGNHGSNGIEVVWIVKLNSSGVLQWQKCFGGTGDDAGFSITQSADSGYTIAGATGSKDGDISGNHGGNDVLVFKLNSSGTTLWQKCLGGIREEYGWSIKSTLDKGYIIAGTTNSNDGDVSENHGGGDLWVVKLSAPLDIIENSSTDLIQNKFFWIYPNPSVNILHLQLLPSLEVKQVQFFDVLGLQHFPEYHIENNIASVDVSHLPSGTYLTRVTWFQNKNNLTSTFTFPLVVQH